MGTEAEGLRFDFTADPSKFVTAAQDVQKTWTSATDGMTKGTEKFSAGLTAIAKKAAEDFGLLGQKIDTGLTAKLEGFKGQADSVLGMMGKFGLTAATRLNPLFGALTTGISLLETFGGTAQAVAGKLGLAEAFKEVEDAASDLGAALQAGLTGDLQTMSDKADVAAFKMRLLLGLTDAIARSPQAFDKVDVALQEKALAQLNERIAATRRELDSLAKSDRELLGNEGLTRERKLKISLTGVEEAAALLREKLTANIELPKLPEFDPDAEEIKPLQLLKIEGHEKIAEAISLTEAISVQLERQIELERLKGEEVGKTTGEIAEQRAMIDAEYRARSRGLELTNEQQDRIQDLSMAMGEAATQAERLNAVRSAEQGGARALEALQIEVATLGMAAGAAAAYRHELTTLNRLKEQHVTVTDAMLERIRTDAQQIGAATDTLTARRSGQQFGEDLKNLERQIELERLKGEEVGKTVGQIAAERAMLEEELKLRQRGVTMTSRMQDDVQDRALKLEELIDANERLNAVRSGSTMAARAVESLRLETETLGMAAGKAAAYRHEMTEINRLKEKGVVITEEMRQKIHAEAAAIGQSTEQLRAKQSKLQLVGEASRVVTGGLTSMWDDFIEGRELKWKKMFDTILAGLSKLMLQKALFEPLTRGAEGLLGGLMGGLPGFADGGPVTAGAPIIVGERGPELFVPAAGGRIVPNHEMRQAGGGGSGPSFTYMIDARGAEIGVESKIAAALSAIRPGIVAEAVKSVRETNIRAPAYLR